MLRFTNGWVVWCDNVVALSTSAFLKTNTSTKIHTETFSGLLSEISLSSRQTEATLCTETDTDRENVTEEDTVN